MSRPSPVPQVAPGYGTREEPQRFQPRRGRRRMYGAIFEWACLAATLVAVAMLAVLLFDVARDGIGWLSLDFLRNFPSRIPARAGIKSALLGTLWIMGMTAVFTVPLGVGAAIYLEEYAADNRLARIIETNIQNLAGVPSIVYGILGLAVFVRFLALGRSVLAGALTLTLLILPIVIIAAREAIRAVPPSIRQAGLALGATQWQTIRKLVLPMALPGILTGIILALSRAIGETAPLIMIGALTFIAFTPSTPADPFTVLPIQIFNWASRPQSDFHHIAAAAIMVLLVVLLGMNAIAIVLRDRWRIER